MSLLIQPTTITQSSSLIMKFPFIGLSLVWSNLVDGQIDWYVNRFMIRAYQLFDPGGGVRYEVEYEEEERLVFSDGLALSIDAVDEITWSDCGAGLMYDLTRLGVIALMFGSTDPGPTDPTDDLHIESVVDYPIHSIWLYFFGFMDFVVGYEEFNKTVNKEPGDRVEFIVASVKPYGFLDGSSILWGLIYPSLWKMISADLVVGDLEGTVNMESLCHQVVIVFGATKDLGGVSLRDEAIDFLGVDRIVDIA